MIVEKDVEVNSRNPQSPNHFIKKKLKLKLCLDPRNLNEALGREPYYSRTVDELIAKFLGAAVFTIVDLGKGYWQVELDSSSRMYMCMALDIGRFQWKRLPVGKVVASDIFQKKLDSIFIGILGIVDYMIIQVKMERGA